MPAGVIGRLPARARRGRLWVAGWFAAALTSCHKPAAAPPPAVADHEKSVLTLSAGGGQGQSANYRLRLLIGPVSPVGGAPGQPVQLGPGPGLLAQAPQ